MQPGPLNAAALPPGTCIGPWRIVDLRGRGAYGAVYLAESVATGEVVALKLALHPWDERFGREVAMLSRIHHPCVPRLIDHGQWRSPAGLAHPYLVMECVDGIPLYAWAQAEAPSSRRVLQVLAGLARALEAVHAAGGVHRDVKGDNALVQLKDGRVFLMDFGASHYLGAAPLTVPPFPPGTPEYRSPEAYWFALHIREAVVKTYSPVPADDLFALGVTGYRLVTGQYPPLPQDPRDAESHVWNPGGPGPRPAHALNPCCGPELSALISRMLSVSPEARGSARELAEALEHAARTAGRRADASLFPREASPSEPVPRAPRQSLSPRMAVGLAGSMALGALWMLCMLGRKHAGPEDSRDGGIIAVGESALTAPVESRYAPSAGTSIALEIPSKPLPGQVQPDARGHCLDKIMVPIKGGCWIEVKGDPKHCSVSGYIYAYKGTCYMPAMMPQRPATSAPVESRDGG